MKKTYLKPETELLLMGTEDMIAASLEMSQTEVNDFDELLEKPEVEQKNIWDE